MTSTSDLSLGSEDRLAWLTLSLVPGVGPERLRQLVDAFGSPGGALVAPLAFLCTVPGVSAACAEAIRATPRDGGARLLEQVERAGARLLVPFDPGFPEALRTIPAPPPWIVVRGRQELLTLPAVAMVGSRNHSRYGEESCRLLAGTAAASGIVVVSGMARGLDTVAHRAALEAGGGTIGVLGTGIDQVYPRSHRALFDRMGAEGLLLTELPPGQLPTPGSFPRRNRLISGLARVTVLVEAAERSGALITAGTALAQGREVCVVPGPITSPTSVGVNRLLRDGATPLLDPDDLLRFYPEATPPAPAAGPEGVRGRILDVLRAGPAQADDLGRALRIPAGDLLGLLSAMELTGLVHQEPGLVFRAALPARRS